MRIAHFTQGQDRSGSGVVKLYLPVIDRGLGPVVGKVRPFVIVVFHCQSKRIFRGDGGKPVAEFHVYHQILSRHIHKDVDRHSGSGLVGAVAAVIAVAGEGIGIVADMGIVARLTRSAVGGDRTDIVARRHSDLAGQVRTLRHIVELTVKTAITPECGVARVGGYTVRYDRVDQGPAFRLLLGLVGDGQGHVAVHIGHKEGIIPLPGQSGTGGNGRGVDGDAGAAIGVYRHQLHLVILVYVHTNGDSSAYKNCLDRGGAIRIDVQVILVGTCSQIGLGVGRVGDLIGLHLRHVVLLAVHALVDNVQLARGAQAIGHPHHTVLIGHGK